MLTDSNSASFHAFFYNHTHLNINTMTKVCRANIQAGDPIINTKLQ